MGFKQCAQGIQHVLVGKSTRSLGDDRLGGIEQIAFDNSLEDAFGTDPLVWGIPYPCLFELERNPVPDVVADIFCVDQHLVNGGTGPGAAEVGHNPASIECFGDFPFELSLVDEHLVDPANGPHLLIGTGNQDYTIGLKALALADAKQPQGFPMFVDAHPAQPIAGRTTLAKAVFDEQALASKRP